MEKSEPSRQPKFDISHVFGIPETWKLVREREIAPNRAAPEIQNLIMSLRVSVVMLVTMAGPPLNMWYAAYCSM
jgi:hypothetical protein